MLPDLAPITTGFPIVRRDNPSRPRILGLKITSGFVTKLNKVQNREITKRKTHRGPKSFLETAKKLKGAGLVQRREFRQNQNVSNWTRKAWRAGFNTAWKYAAQYMKRRGIKRPGQFRPDNQHGGKLWSSRKECTMTDKAAGEILERVYESGKVSSRQLMQVRHSLSYAYYLKTGIGGDNWPEVKAQWRSYKIAGLPETIRTVTPTKIPMPENLKEAFTTQWTPDCGLTLTEFMVGVLACWDTHVFGLRPNVDVKKVKDSRDHHINGNDGYGKTAMVNGRSKLHLNKAGTRPWWVYRSCTCKGKHKTPTSRQMRVKDGNPRIKPTWNTACPVAAMQFLQHHQGADFRPYPRTNKNGAYCNQNIGDVPSFANEWLSVQGQAADDGSLFDRHSGRKSLARWLGHLQVPYHESLPIHGDLECVWRGAYQDGLHRSHYRVREQPTDSDVATKGLRRFTRWLHDANGGPSIKDRLRDLLLSL